MKTLLGNLSLLAVLLTLSAVADAQVYTKFGPANGVLKGSTSTFQTTAAASTDIISLWTGTCDPTHFLAGDGTCAVPTGVIPSGAANLIYATPNGSSGAATLRALVGADQAPINLGSTANGGVLSTSILLGTNGGTSNGFLSFTGPATSLKTFTLPNASANILTSAAAITVAQGGTGLATLPAHGVLLGEGTGNVGNVAAMPVDTLLQGQGAGVDPAGLLMVDCNSPSALNYHTSGPFIHTFTCNTVVTFAAPTSLVGPTAHTGSSGISMASDSAPGINLTSTYPWTGPHTYTEGSTTTAITINSNGNGSIPDFQITGSVNGGVVANMTNTSTGTGATADFNFSNGTHVAAIEMLGINNTEGEFMSLGTNSPGIRFGAAGGVATGFITYISGVAKMTLLGPNAAAQVDMTPDKGTFTAGITGCTTSPTATAVWRRSGGIVVLAIPLIFCTSNSNSLTITGIPAAIEPATLQQQPTVVGVDNGATVVASAFVHTVVGSLQIAKVGGTTAWTTSGTKGTQINISYLLD